MPWTGKRPLPPPRPGEAPPCPPRPHLSDGLGEGPAEPAQAGEGAGAARHLSRAQGAQVGLQLQGQAVQHLRLLEAQLTCAKGGQLSARGLRAPRPCAPHATGDSWECHLEWEGSRDTSEPSQSLNRLQVSWGGTGDTRSDGMASH